MSGRLDFEYGFNSNNAQPIEPDAPMRMKNKRGQSHFKHSPLFFFTHYQTI